MIIFFNIFFSLIYFFFLHFFIWGYGSVIKEKYIKNLNFGETGVYGLIIVYLITLFIHYIYPINYLVIYIIKIVGIFFALKNYSLIKKLNYKIIIKVLIIFIILFICSLTTTVHDDFYWYHLPTINYIHENKIIFGLASLNDQLGYGQGYFYFSTLFLDPYFKSNFIYHPSLIILTFFLVFMIEDNYKNKMLENKILFYIFFSIIFLKFTRFKEYGADIFAFCILGMISYYLIKFYKNNQLDNLIKSITLLIFGFFIKQYVIIIVFFFTYYLFKLKIKVFEIFKNRLFLIIIFLIIALSSIKNIIQTGCIVYPIPTTCISINEVKWGLGKDVAKKRFDHLQAYAKGIRIKAKNSESADLNAEKYLYEHKYNFHKQLINYKDHKDLEKIAIVVILILAFKIILKKSSKLNYKINFSNYKIFVFIFSILMSFIYWIWEAPSMRFGGYIFIIIPLFVFLFFLPMQKNNIYINFRKINILVIFIIVVFLFKNINRISGEIVKNKNFPKHNIINIDFSVSDRFILPVNISNHEYFCGNIKTICSPKANTNSVSLIEKKRSYYFIYPNRLDHISKIDKELNDIMYSIEKFSPTYVPKK